MYSFYTYTYKGIDDMTGKALYTFNDHDYYVPGMTKAGEDISKREAIPAGEYVVIDGVPYVYKPATYGKREWHGSAVPYMRLLKCPCGIIVNFAGKNLYT